jgi:hypothetical protein
MDEERIHMTVLAREPFVMINEYLQAQRNSGTVSPSQRLAVTTISEPNDTVSASQRLAVTTISEPNEIDEVGRENFGQHLISGFVRRRSDDDQWRVESTWESVNILRLDEIRLAGDYEWQPLNYIGGPDFVKIAMLLIDNVVLFRNIFDWSRSDGDVMSQQIVWRDNFEKCQRILQVLEENNDTTSPLKLVRESFHLHPDLREQHIIRHSNDPLVATMAAVGSSQNVYISQELAGTGDGESDSLLCAICHDLLSTGQPATELRCNHLFHTRCIVYWFERQISCPLCRDELK